MKNIYTLDDIFHGKYFLSIDSVYLFNQINRLFSDISNNTSTERSGFRPHIIGLFHNNNNIDNTHLLPHSSRPPAAGSIVVVPCGQVVHFVFIRPEA